MIGRYLVYFSPLIMNINFKNSFSTPIPLKITPKAQNLVLLMTEKWSTVPHCKLRNDQWCHIENWEMINGSRLNTEKWSAVPNWKLRNTKHHWSFLSFQSGTVDHFSVFNVAPLIISQFSMWHRWSFLSHEKHEVLSFRGYFEGDRDWKWIFKVDILNQWAKIHHISIFVWSLDGPFNMQKNLSTRQIFVFSLYKR